MKKQIRFEIEHGETIATALPRRFARWDIPFRLAGRELHVRLHAFSKEKVFGNRRAQLQWPVAEAAEDEEEQPAEPECCTVLEEGDALRNALARALPQKIKAWSPPESWGTAQVRITLRIYRSRNAPQEA